MTNGMIQPKICPPPSAWQALLAGALPPHDMHQMEAHLELCSACAEGLSSFTPALPPLLLEAARETASHLETPDFWYERLRSSFLDNQGTGESTASVDANQEFTTNQAGPAPARVGDYELIERIGRGGMGVVYRARQLKLQREVAVKMLPVRQYQSPAAVERLIAEARRLAQVRHPNIVQVYDVGEQDDIPYFSMELIQGSTASRVARLAEPWPPRRVAQLMATVAEAVQAAHSVGIIHRDLKPANILLTAADEPKVTDFGLATTRDESMAGGTGSSGGAAGTAEYMAPEQWAGDIDLITVRTDVYGLGTILYALLTGRPPFSRDPNPSKTKQRVLYETPKAPRSIRPGVPRDLEAICTRCLQKAPDQRYSSAQEMADDLRRFAQRRPVSARPVGFVGHAAYAVRRNWAQIATAAAIILVAAGIIVGHGISTLPAKQLAEANSLFDAGASDAKDGRVNDGLVKMQSAIARVPAGHPQLVRYFEQTHARWAMLAPRPLGQLPTHPAVITSASVSPDGQTVLFGDKNGGVFLWSLAGNSVRPLAPTTGPSTATMWATAFNRAGTRCAAGGADSIVRIWDVKSGVQLSECKVSPFIVNAVGFLGDGDEFVTGSSARSGSVRVWSAKSFPAVPIGTGDAQINMPAIRIVAPPDGAAFVVGCAGGRWWMCDKSGRVLHDFGLIAGERIDAAEYSHDASTVVIAGTEIRKFNLQTEQASAPSPRIPSGIVKSLAFRTDGGATLILEDGSRTIVRQMTPDLDSWDDSPLDSRSASVHVAGADSVVLLTGQQTHQLRLCQLPGAGRRSVRVGEYADSANVSTSADGQHIVTRVQLPLSKEIREGKKHSREVTDQPFEVSIWEAKSLKRIASINQLPNRKLPIAIAHHPHSDEIAIGCAVVDGPRGDVLIGRPTADGSISLQTLGSHACNVGALVYAPNGLHLYSSSAMSEQNLPAEIVCWDAGTHQEIDRINYPCTVYAMAVSPDSRFLAVGGSDGIVRVYSIDNLRAATTLELSVAGTVSAIAFSGDGQLLACANVNGRVVLLRREGDQLTVVGESINAQSSVSSLVFGQDSKCLYISPDGPDAGVTSWNTDLSRQIGPVFSMPGVIRDFAIAGTPPAIICLTREGRLGIIPITSALSP